MNETFMKEKPILPLLASLALPMVLSMLVNALYNIVDSYYVAQISEDAMTALSLVYPVQNLINAIAIGFGIGINALIALHLGAGDRAKASLAASHGLFFALVHSLVITVVSIAVMPAFLEMFTSDEAVIAMGVEYASIAFLFFLAIMLSLSYEKILQSVGRMKITMAALLCGCVANIVLDPLMIFGFGPFPEMGIAGAALATGIGQVLTVVIYLVACKVYPLPMEIRLRGFSFCGEIDRKLYAIGVPAILNLALPSLMISALNALLSLYAQSYVVILGGYYKLQTFLYLPANGIIQGMRPLMGYNYGAGEDLRVRKLFRTTLCMTGIIMALGTAVCWIWAVDLIGLFTENPETIRLGAQALRIISAGFLVSAAAVTASGALEGLGKGTASLVISVCRYVAVILPAAWLLCRLWGPAGVWHAFWITEAVTAAVAAYTYRRALRQPRPSL